MCINIYKPYPITYISSKSIYSKFINKKKVNHIDGNKLNSKLTNLECCTASENSQNAHDTGLNTTNQKPIIQYDIEMNKIEASKNYYYVNISSCCNGKQKTAGGFIFKFV